VPVLVARPAPAAAAPAPAPAPEVPPALVSPAPEPLVIDEPQVIEEPRLRVVPDLPVGTTGELHDSSVIAGLARTQSHGWLAIASGVGLMAVAAASSTVTRPDGSHMIGALAAAFVAFCIGGRLTEWGTGMLARRRRQRTVLSDHRFMLVDVAFSPGLSRRKRGRTLRVNPFDPMRPTFRLVLTGASTRRIRNAGFDGVRQVEFALGEKRRGVVRVPGSSQLFCCVARADGGVR